MKKIILTLFLIPPLALAHVDDNLESTISKNAIVDYLLKNTGVAEITVTMSAKMRGLKVIPVYSFNFFNEDKTYIKNIKMTYKDLSPILSSFSDSEINKLFRERFGFLSTKIHEQRIEKKSETLIRFLETLIIEEKLKFIRF